MNEIHDQELYFIKFTPGNKKNKIIILYAVKVQDYRKCLRLETCNS